MTKTMNRIAAGAVAALALGLASAGVYAVQPAAGEMTATSNAVAPAAQYSHFEVLGARAMPASGQHNAVADTAPRSMLTRAQVENRVIRAAQDHNGFPDASGQMNL